MQRTALSVNICMHPNIIQDQTLKDKTTLQSAAPCNPEPCTCNSMLRQH